MENQFIKNGLHFECKRCSSCCGKAPGFVYLSKRDLLELCNYLQLSIKDFVQKYCRWADYYWGTQVLALKEKDNYDCILWENGCSCYNARPIQCSTYPFWTWMIKEQKTWEECAKDCPGINNGKLWNIEEINKNEELYRTNKPLHKEDVEKLM